jgi:hypothetical protein
MQTHTLQSFANLLTQMAANMPTAQHHAMEQACQVVETEAKRVIGTYDYGWPQLAASTQADRVSKGFSANDPLLRTGEMRDSINHVSSPVEGRIGSNDDKALWQELGTRTIPPRSFLAGALRHEANHVVAILGQAVRGYLETGSGRALSTFIPPSPAQMAWPAQRVI